MKQSALKCKPALYSWRILLVKWCALLFTLDIGTMDFRFSSLLKRDRMIRMYIMGKDWLEHQFSVLTSESLVCVFCCRSCRKWFAKGGSLELWACCLVMRRNLWGGNSELHQTGWGWRVDLQPGGNVQRHSLTVFSSGLYFGDSYLVKINTN